MSTPIDAADTIKRLTKQYEDLKLAADLLQEFGTFDQALKEIKRFYAETKDEYDLLKKKLEKLKMQETEIHRRNDALLLDLEAERNSMLEEVKKHREEAIAASEKEISKYYEENRKQIEKDKKEAEIVVLQIIETKTRLLAEIKELEDKRAEAVKEYETYKKQLSEIKTKLAQITSAIE